MLTREFNIKQNDIELLLLDLSYKKFLVIFFKGSPYKYLLIPQNVLLKKIQSRLVISCFCSSSREADMVFLNTLSYIVYSLKNAHKTKILMNGLGFKANLVGEDLNFKLGFSHEINVCIDCQKLQVSVIKNVVQAYGFDNVLLGDFSSRLKNLRVVDVYKKKGLYFKYDNIIQKEIKKK